VPTLEVFRALVPVSHLKLSHVSLRGGVILVPPGGMDRREGTRSRLVPLFCHSACGQQYENVSVPCCAAWPADSPRMRST